ncbi:MAG: copper amine oxidase N-terminal domain-containing protein, partial [Candidatus Ornithomonoglobus sp.]
GKNEAFVNDRKVELEAAAEITGDRTFVPLHFVMESLGAQVDWDGDTYTVSITTE